MISTRTRLSSPASTSFSSCIKCDVDDIFQDPDVLDTWFSSGLWPLSTLGWPDEAAMKEKRDAAFYPNPTLITGFHIIYFLYQVRRR